MNFKFVEVMSNGYTHSGVGIVRRRKRVDIRTAHAGRNQSNHEAVLGFDADLSAANTPQADQIDRKAA